MSPEHTTFGNTSADQATLLADYLEKAAALADLPAHAQRTAAEDLDEDAEEDAYSGGLDVLDGLDTIRRAIYRATGYTYEYATKTHSQ